MQSCIPTIFHQELEDNRCLHQTRAFIRDTLEQHMYQKVNDKIKEGTNRIIGLI